MPISYTNRKGQTYTLYKGQTKSGKPRYYFGRTSQEGEPVTELPPGFTISESVNGVVSLSKEHPSLIQPEETATIEAVVKQHPQGHQYRVVTKHDYIEIYEPIGPSFDEFARLLQDTGVRRSPDAVANWRAEHEQRASYTPVLRFTLLDPAQRCFGAKRMCYRSSVDGWLELHQTGPGPIAKLAATLIPTLGTDEFFELW